MRRPSRRIGTGPLQNPLAKWNDQAALLRKWDELAGKNQSAFGMSPAHQRFDATAFPALDVDYGLIVKLEFAARYSLTQVVFKLPAFPRIFFQGDVKQAISISALGFG